MIFRSAGRLKKKAPPRTRPDFLVWALSRRRFNRRRGGASFFLRQFLCSIRKPVSSSRPALRLRRRAQKLSRLAIAPTLRHAPPLPGHTLTASSTTARPRAIGLTIRGEPACGRDQSRHNLVFGGCKNPNHDAVIRIGREPPHRPTHSPLLH